MTFASGKKAWGISDRSGFRYRLKDMKKEWTGALVGPDEFETKQPQLRSPKVTPDPQALRNPRPEQNLAEQRNIQYGFNPVGFNSILGLTPPSNLESVGGIGTITVTTVVNPGAENIAYMAGLSAPAFVDSVTIISGSSTASRFDSTSVTLDSTTKTFDEG